VVSEKKIFEISVNQIKLLALAAIECLIYTKNATSVKNHPITILTRVCSNCQSGFREED
jgi:hypothetical protein